METKYGPMLSGELGGFGPEERTPSWALARPRWGLVGGGGVKCWLLSLSRAPPVRGGSSGG